MIRTIAKIGFGLALFSAHSLFAQGVTLGSPLTAEPNISIGCEAQPAIADTSGNFGLFFSNVADCTWRQSGVFGVTQGDPRFSSVPGDGVITSVSVRSGPNPAPFRITILRQLSTPGFGEVSQCCFFQSETNTLTPAPNAITTFPVNIPVARNTINGFFAVDLVALSAASGTGTLPLHSTGQNNSFQLTTFGSVNAGFFYPRVGAIPNDVGGGRREEGIPGIEVLMNFNWCPLTAGVLGCSPARLGIASVTPVVSAGQAALDLICNGNAVCKGLIEILAVGSAAKNARKAKKGGKGGGTPGLYGKKRYNVKASTTKKLKVELVAAAKKAVKNGGSLSAVVRITPDGLAPVTTTVTLTKK